MLEHILCQRTRAGEAAAPLLMYCSRYVSCVDMM